MDTSNDVSEREKDKTLRLIEYLKSLTALRSRVVENVCNYHNHLWFHEIPKQKGCFTQAWALSETTPEIWLEVKKRTEPPVLDTLKYVKIG